MHAQLPEVADMILLAQRPEATDMIIHAQLPGPQA